jgi:hypothetical protein
MYSPKIRVELVRKLYFYARRRGVPMTYIVNALLDQLLCKEPEPYEDLHRYTNDERRNT